jgi:hypothetical protein
METDLPDSYRRSGFLRVKSLPIYRSCRLRNSNWCSTLRPQKQGSEGRGPRGMQCNVTRASDPAPAQVYQSLDCIRVDDPSLPKVGAVCGKAPRTALCGGRSAMSVPTAIDTLCCGAYVSLWHEVKVDACPRSGRVLEGKRTRARWAARQPAGTLSARLRVRLD